MKFDHFLRLLIVSVFILVAQALFATTPKILIKINSQGNSEQVFTLLERYYESLSNELPVSILLSCNLDEQTLKSAKFKKQCRNFRHLTLLSSSGKTSSEAYNLGLADFADKFDILIVTSEDLIPAVKGYDKLIADAFVKNCPNGDGVLNIFCKDGINLAPIIGKTYYQRFGYIYNSLYEFSSYDREFTSITRILGKEVLHDLPVLKPSKEIKNLLIKNPIDEGIFKARQIKNFDISEENLDKLFQKDWSILICTLDERAKQFDYILNKLQKQIKENHLEDKIEILFFKDNRENTVGYKRNALIKRSQGKYINFVDDDDDVSDVYIKSIYEELKSRPDCVSLVGIITFDGQNPATFIHSVKFKSYFQTNGVYYRPPNHLNPMKRSIAAQFLFPMISFGEDTDWAMRISQTGLLQKEREIISPYYFYRYLSKK